MIFLKTDRTYKGHTVYSNGVIDAVKNGAIFKGSNANVVKRDLYLSHFCGMYFIVPIGTKLVGGSFIESVNIER